MVWWCQYLIEDGSTVRCRDKGKVSDWCHCALTPLIMSARSSFSHVSLSNYPSHDSTPKSSLSLFSVFFTPLTSSSLLSCVTQYIPVRLHVVMDQALWDSSYSEYEINIISPHCCIILIQFWWKFAVTGNFSPSPQKTLFHPYPAFSQYLLTNHLFPHIQSTKSQKKVNK